MTCSSPTRAAFVFLLGLAGIGLLATGCSSSSQAPSAASPEPAPTGPALSFLYTTAAEGLVLHDAHTDTTRTLVPGATHDGVYARSPSGRYLAFTYTTADSVHLALLDLPNQTMQTVDRRAADATYSLAWHSEDNRLAFAYYTPARSGTRGPGDVFVATPDGETRNVGCSAAREVLDWLPDGALATRNDDKLYVVAPGDCATRAAADARRMRHAAYAPTGARLAYIHRELTYDRSANEYTPDSSLFLSDAKGQGAEELLGPERRVRHLRWAPDASELAFDAHVEASGYRQIVSYNTGSDRTVYLTPPGQATGNQVHPRWSPSASSVAFTLRTGGQPTAAVRVEGQLRQFGPVDGAVWGWLDDRTLVVPGPDQLRIETLDGQTEYTRPAPATLIYTWRRTPA
jgi:Tol biopolymer transport system component